MRSPPPSAAPLLCCGLLLCCALRALRPVTLLASRPGRVIPRVLAPTFGTAEAKAQTQRAQQIAGVRGTFA
jgi:hypothetical protein